MSIEGSAAFMVGFFKWLWAPFIALFGGYAVKVALNKRQDISTLKERVTGLENSAVKEERVREIVREEIGPIKDNTIETKAKVNDILEALAKIQLDMAADRAVKDYVEKHKKQE